MSWGSARSSPFCRSRRFFISLTVPGWTGWYSAGFRCGTEERRDNAPGEQRADAQATPAQHRPHDSGAGSFLETMRHEGKMRTDPGGERIFTMTPLAASAALLGTSAAAMALLLPGYVLALSCLELGAAVGVAGLAYRTCRIRIAERMGRSERVHLATIEALACAIEVKDPYSRGRVRRVQAYALELARCLRLPRKEVEAIRAAALLHDIGKLAIPDHLLQKPGKLSDIEYQKVKAHPSVAADILANVHFPYPLLPAVRHHHER